MEILLIQAQKSQILKSISNKDQFSNETKESDVYLVELNYLKTKGLVNDEEIETKEYEIKNI
jgi:hypothetical protein